MAVSIDDRKISHLPGLADDDEPCVYETEDPPEDDIYPLYEESDAVEIIDLPIEEGFGMFKDKTLDPKRVDFSDRLRAWHHTGYKAGSKGESITRKSYADNSLLARYERLSDQLNQLEQQVTAEVKEGGSDDSVLLQHINQLQAQVKQLDPAQSMIDKMDTLKDDPSMSLTKSLEKHLSQLQFSNRQLKPAVAAADGCGVQLHVRVDQESASRSAQLVAVQKRLVRLEAVLGTTPEKMSRLSAVTRCRSLLPAAICLNSRVALLDSQSLQLVCSRLSSLQLRLRTLIESQQQQKDKEERGDERCLTSAQISELFDSMKEVSATRQQLPSILQRLQSLQYMQQQAVEVGSVLTRLQLDQSHLTSSVDRCQDELQKLDKLTADSFKSAGEQLQSLQQLK